MKGTVRVDGKIGTYVSSGWGFSTSSYWIEGPTGLVLIDTQFLLSAAKELVDTAEKSTGKKAVLAIVLHANPDKFNGTDVLRARGIKVVTSQEVRDLIPDVHAKRTRAFYERYKPDYPTAVPLPDSFGDHDTDLEGGGVTVHAHVVGAGCSMAHVVVEYDHRIFAGDLVANGTHSWLELAQIAEWQKRIAEMKAMQPTVVYPGRGPAGGPELLDREKKYIDDFVNAVAMEQPKLPIDPAGLARAKKRMTDAYPGYDYDVFLDIGLPAEWERQAKRTPVEVGPRP